MIYLILSIFTLIIGFIIGIKAHIYATALEREAIRLGIANYNEDGEFYFKVKKEEKNLKERGLLRGDFQKMSSK